MNVKRFRLSRRAVLRGAGSIAIALPWLEAMDSGKAHAQTTTPAARFITVYQPGGTVLDRWLPTGPDDNMTLSPILAPLEPVKSRILVVQGMDMACAALGLGEQHQAGIVSWLTGTVQGEAGLYAKGPSIDQVIATRISKNIKPFGSLQIAIRWATGKSHGLLSPINSANFEDNTQFSPIPPRLDPVEIWNDLFGSLNAGEGSEEAARILRKRSILDFVDRKYVALSQRLGTADKARLDEHLNKIREIEMSLMVPPSTNGSCAAPTLVDTTGYNAKTGLNADDNGEVRDTSTDSMIPVVGKLMTDMLVMALACDLTAVASLQWSDTEAKHTFPWLNLTEHHHYYQHDGGFKPVECEAICRWYSEQHLYLIQQMAAVDMGGHSLLDESVVFFGSELQQPPDHEKDNMPFMLAGNGGGLRTGRKVTYQDQPHNNLLVSLLNLFGDTRTTFGNAQYCTGPVSGLT